MAARDEVELAVRAVGTKQASTALGNVRKATDSVSASAKRQAGIASQLQGRLTQATTATKGLTASTTRLRTTMASTAASQQRAAQAAQRYATASRGNILTNKELGRSFGSTTNVVAETSFAIGQAIPGMRQLSTTMAIAGGSAFQMGAQFGLIGGVLGAIIPLTGQIASAFMDMGDAAEEAKGKFAALEEQSKQVKKAIEAQIKEQKRLAGEVSIEEQASLLKVAEERVHNQREEVEAAREELEKAQQSLQRLPETASEALRETLRQQVRNQENQLQQTRGELQRLETSRIQLTEAFRKNLAQGDEELSVLRGLRQSMGDRVAILTAIEKKQTTPFEAVAFGGEGGGGSQSETRQRRSTSRPEESPLDRVMRRQVGERSGVVQAPSEFEGAPFGMGARGAGANQSLTSFMSGRQGEVLQPGRMRSRVQQLSTETQQSIKETQKLADTFADKLEKMQQRMNKSLDSIDQAVDRGPNKVIRKFDEMSEEFPKLARNFQSSGQLMSKTAQATGNAIFDSIGNKATAGLKANIAAMTQGEKTAKEAFASIAKSAIEALVVEASVRALFQLAQGFAVLFTNPPQAAAHFTSAAIYGAVAGVGAGAAAAIGGTGGGGGGGGGGASSNRRGAPGGGGAGGGSSSVQAAGKREVTRNVVVNVQTGQSIATEEDVGRAVKKSIKAADRQDGTTVGSGPED